MYSSSTLIFVIIRLDVILNGLSSMLVLICNSFNIIFYFYFYKIRLNAWKTYNGGEGCHPVSAIIVVLDVILIFDEFSSEENVIFRINGDTIYYIYIMMRLRASQTSSTIPTI